MTEDEDSKFSDAPSADVYTAQRNPRRGDANPEAIDYAFWRWMVQSEASPYEVAEHYDAPGAMEAGPGWNFQRMGISRTSLPDGREVFIAGEHEDYYDPDFYIYNDVIVKHPNGEIEIFAYPEEVFRPTDFHSATLVGDEIYIVGSLGNPDDRQDGVTQIVALNTQSFAIRGVIASGGDNPGWISHHQALFRADANVIDITGGEIWNSKEPSGLLENINDFRLHLSDMRWEQLTDRKWQRFEFFRPDGEGLATTDEPKWKDSMNVTDEQLLDPDFDLTAKLMGSLEERASQPDALDIIWPEIDHQRLPALEFDDEDDENTIGRNEFSTRRAEIGDCTVRYVQGIESWMLTIEGSLPRQTVVVLQEDLKSKLAAHFDADVQWRAIGK